MNQSILGLTLIAALASGCSGPATPPPSGTTGGQGPATATPPAASQPGPATAATPAAPQPGASQSPAPPPAEPLAPPAPTFREVTIPADTTLTVKLETPVASDKSQVEDTVRGTLAKPIVIAGETVVPAGAELAGTVTESSQSGRVKGRAMVAFAFDRLTVRGESHRIETTRVAREAEANKKDDVKKGAVGAGAGAIVGGIAGGGKGAAIGAAVGGTSTVLATKGKEVRLPVGSTVSTSLRSPLTVRVPVS